MAINPDFRDLFSELSVAEARYLLVGGYAVMLYTAPRFTKDLDIWVEPSPENAPKVQLALGRFGAPMAEITLADLATPGTIFQIGVEPNRIDVLTSVEGLLFPEAWGRRKESAYGDVPVFVADIEDLIANKRAVGRPQDLIDVANMERARKG